MNNSDEREFSIVAVDKFIQATRDSGYTGTATAVAELIDSSLQAEAISYTTPACVCPRPRRSSQCSSMIWRIERGDIGG